GRLDQGRQLVVGDVGGHTALEHLDQLGEGGQDLGRLGLPGQGADHAPLALHAVVVAGRLPRPGVGEGGEAVEVPEPGLDVERRCAPLAAQAVDLDVQGLEVVDGD